MNRSIATAAVIFLIALAMVRVALTYDVFSATYDEPYHIGAGMEWIASGTADIADEAPPIARIALAAGPYVAGKRPHGIDEAVAEGNAILLDGNYLHNLRLARMGNLLFLILACLSVYLWAKRWFGPATALWSLLLFSNLTLLLGNSGIATIDVACTASMTIALYALIRWLEEPTNTRMAYLAAAVGFTICCKFSAFVFLPACAGIAALLLLVFRRRLPFSISLPPWRTFRTQIGVFVGVSFLVIWAVYRFSVEPILQKGTPRTQRIEQAVSSRPLLRKAVQLATTVPIPAARMISGLGSLQSHNAVGHGAYLLGQYGKSGWWYYFPVVIAVKTPIGLMLLAAWGCALLLRDSSKEVSLPWQKMLVFLFPAAILFGCMNARINIGVRHALPIYPFLCILAAHALATAWKGRRLQLASGVATLLALWMLAGSWLAHPDYLANFNEIAGNHPERFVLDSNLDWGQDLHRLALRLHDLHVDRVAIAYFGSEPMEAEPLPPRDGIPRDKPVPGWVAISLYTKVLVNVRDGGYEWLKAYQPRERIGKSIDLYYIDAPQP